VVPPRPGAPVDARALRAQAAVQQLKKLAPPPEPPRAKSRSRMPTLDDDGDVTDVELRVAAVQQQGGPPKIVDDDETGEELPTLVQKEDAQINALREARKQARAQAEQQKAPKPPYVSPGLIVDEDSDQRITAVKQDKQRAATPGVVSIVDHESDAETAPIDTNRAKQMAPGKPVIPPAPNVPPHPFPLEPKAPPKAPGSAFPPPPVRSAPPPHAETQRAAVAALPPPPTRPPEPPTPAPGVPTATLDPLRASQHDDVQVIDRNVLRHQVLHTEEGLLAESDRLAIEAVRRGEEARAAQLRAERKAAAAKLATEAARIAAEAAQLIRTAGVAAAAKRLEEAHALEQQLQSGRFPVSTSSGAASASGPYPAASDAVASSERPSAFPEPQRAITYGGGFPGVDTARAIAITGAAQPPSVPPPPGSLPPAPPGYEMGPQSVVPIAPVSAPIPSVPPSMPPGPRSLAPPAAAPVVDPIVDQLKPSILGLPSNVVVGLAVVMVFVVILLALMLAK
jgi:hypothetical protein